ncbi:MAG: hypothetical protein ACLFNQ_09295 [Spirochaetaceae bacterium]
MNSPVSRPGVSRRPAVSYDSEPVPPKRMGAGQKSPESIGNVARAIAGSAARARFEEVPKQDHMVDAKTLLLIMDRFFGDGGE